MRDGQVAEMRQFAETCHRNSSPERVMRGQDRLLQEQIPHGCLRQGETQVCLSQSPWTHPLLRSL